MTYAWDWDLPLLSLRHHYGHNTKGSDNQSFFINGSESWKVSAALLKLEDFILALSMEVLEGFILALLLDGHVQVVKSWKVSSSLLELKGLILALPWMCWKVSSLHYY